MMEVNPLISGVLHVIHEDGDVVYGAKRFQKLIFILAHEFGIPFSFDFHDDKFGPFSGSLREFLRDLERRGYIEINTKFRPYTFKLTPSGKEVITENEFLELPEKPFTLETSDLVEKAYRLRDKLKKLPSV